NSKGNARIRTVRIRWKKTASYSRRLNAARFIRGAISLTCGFTRRCRSDRSLLPLWAACGRSLRFSQYSDFEFRIPCYILNNCTGHGHPRVNGEESTAGLNQGFRKSARSVLCARGGKEREKRFCRR